MVRSRRAALTLIVCIGCAGVATAQQPIEGYTYCGTKDFETGSWHYGASHGAFLNSYARGMSCSAARRNVDRTKTRNTPPYAPYRTGYRCREIKSAHEYSSVRCVKNGSTTEAYRYITAS